MSKASTSRKSSAAGEAKSSAKAKRSSAPPHKGETVGQQMIAGLRQLDEDMEAGKDITKIYTFHRVKLSVDIPEYKAGDVKRVRDQFHASQAVFAIFLGVGPEKVSGTVSPQTSPDRSNKKVQGPLIALAGIELTPFLTSGRYA